ncbi:MAG: CRISPR-associated protein Cas4 [Candidatus Thorarchaeota archaeon]
MSTEFQTVGPDGTILTDGMRITGTMVNYYLVCERKLWLHAHHLGHEEASELVQLGKLLHERAFPREKKEILILGQIKVDHTTAGETLVVHELKKTESQHPAARAQLLFYMLALELLGIPSRGELHFRNTRQKQPVILDNESRQWITEVLRGVVSVLRASVPPSIPPHAPCRRCAYRDYCEV